MTFLGRKFQCTLYVTVVLACLDTLQRGDTGILHIYRTISLLDKINACRIVFYKFVYSFDHPVLIAQTNTFHFEVNNNKTTLG
jgi:hypothetical protein